MKTEERIQEIGILKKKIHNDVGSDIVNLAEKVNEVIARVNELSLPEKKEEVNDEVETRLMICKKNGHTYSNGKINCEVCGKVKKEEPTQELGIKDILEKLDEIHNTLHSIDEWVWK